MTGAAVRHPAKFSREVLAFLAGKIEEETWGREQPIHVLDPFAGVGLIHVLAAPFIVTYGNELEPEWAEQRAGTIVGDATNLVWPARTFDVIATSPSYGNRMADTYGGDGGCRGCGGLGYVLTSLGGLEAGDLLSMSDVRRQTCSRCGGGGRDRSTRATYRIALGRPLSEGSGSSLQWGDAYRALHRAALGEMVRVLKPGGLLLLNMSDHVRDGKVVPVVNWWLEQIARHPLDVERVEPIGTQRMRHGANADLRADHEVVIVARAECP